MPVQVLFLEVPAGSHVSFRSIQHDVLRAALVDPSTIKSNLIVFDASKKSFSQSDYDS